MNVETRLAQEVLRYYQCCAHSVHLLFAFFVKNSLPTLMSPTQLNGANRLIEILMHFKKEKNLLRTEMQCFLGLIVLCNRIMQPYPLSVHI